MTAHSAREAVLSAMGEAIYDEATTRDQRVGTVGSGHLAAAALDAAIAHLFPVDDIAAVLRMPAYATAETSYYEAAAAAVVALLTERLR